MSDLLLFSMVYFNWLLGFILKDRLFKVSIDKYFKIHGFQTGFKVSNPIKLRNIMIFCSITKTAMLYPWKKPASLGTAISRPPSPTSVSRSKRGASWPSWVAWEPESPRSSRLSPRTWRRLLGSSTWTAVAPTYRNKHGKVNDYWRRFLVHTNMHKTIGKIFFTIFKQTHSSCEQIICSDFENLDTKLLI